MRSGEETRKMLHRPRIHTLIHAGLETSLLVMMAGPGYGKTQAMADYIQRSAARVLWLRLGSLDNLTGHFWDHLLRTMKREYPQIAPQLESAEFPSSGSAFDSFIRLVRENVCGQGQVVWVFDDYGEIENQQVRDFTRMLAGANIEGFHLALLSNAMSKAETVVFMQNKRSVITTEDLRFTQSEIREIYQMYDITLVPDEVKAVERYTEGWPFALGMLAPQHEHLQDMLREDKCLTSHVIARLFEEQFYSAYSKQLKKLLIKLSLLESFPKEFFASLYEGDPAEFVLLENHAFIINEPMTDRFYLHNLYHLFLREKTWLLSPEEQRIVWRKAAEYCVDSRDFLSAVEYYHKCGDHMGLMRSIDRHIQVYSEMAESTAAFFLEHIDLLTPEQIREYPRIIYLKAWTCMMLVMLEEAERLLCGLEKQLLEPAAQCLEGGVFVAMAEEDRHNLLCDVYITLGLIHMMQNREAFSSDFQRAAEAFDFISPEQKAGKSGKLRMLNGNAFSMADNQPGAKERMERATHRVVPFMTKVWSGDISGMEHMFSAESAYLTLEFDEAQRQAQRCLETATAFAQHDLVCNAHLLMARIGYMQGDLGEMTGQINALSEYARANNQNIVQRIWDTALGWYYVSLGQYEKIPQSIHEFALQETHNLAYGRPQIVYASYLINTGGYARLIGMLEHPKGLYLTRGIWPDRITRYIMLAIGYHRLSNNDAAMAQLWEAYDLCYNNGLVTLFIEAGDNNHMNSLIARARRQNKYGFAPQWLDLIDRESAIFAKRAETLRQAYRRKIVVDSNVKNPLTKRERAVLQAIASGLTREEIAIEQFVSVNTVKTTIRNIYNKLDANNKGDAVSIAITRGYITGIH